MRRLPRYVLFLGAKFRTISFLHNTQKWVKKRRFISYFRQKSRLRPTNLLFHYPQIVSARPRRQRSHRLTPHLERRTTLLKCKKSPTFAVKRRTFTTPVQCSAMRVGVSRYAEARLAQRHFGNQAAAVHECQREAELSVIICRLIPHQQAEGRHVQRGLGLRF